ncbi:MAG: aminodeoxychorismate synthase component I [Thermoanaerobaculia bacterium]
MSPAPRIVLRVPTADGRREWRAFEEPLEILQARTAEEVTPLLEAVARANGEGLWAAGFVSYEAALAFDSAFVTSPPGELPLAWFALFQEWRSFDLEPQPASTYSLSDWRPSTSADDYEQAVDSIHRWIAEGDTYQVNYTIRLRADFAGDAWGLFTSLARAQRAPRSAFVDTGERWAICSSSPERFFHLDDDRIVCRPMKGTAPRGRYPEEDRRRGEWLRQSAKNRAENLMIVDMVRNDLGRIAQPGTVEVTSLFELERYPSIHQLTSTVEARTDATAPELFTALFPCASITGAPRVRTMELIHRLEREPRGVYTGAIGCIGPERQAHFNVAIRTVQIDRQTGVAEYGAGGGIVWDSVASDEYRECRTKTLVLSQTEPEFSLLETMLWEPENGFFLLDRHLGRLRSSALYFDRPFDLEAIRAELDRVTQELPPTPHRVRILVDRSGDVVVQQEPLAATGRRWRVRLANRPVDPENRLLFHKISYRDLYDEARADFPDHDDVLLWNNDRELTESTIANVVVQLDGELVTPPVDCGLLPGVFRAELLETGEIREQVVTLEDLGRAERIYLVNSVRRWLEVDLEGLIQEPEMKLQAREPVGISRRPSP